MLVKLHLLLALILSAVTCLHAQPGTWAQQHGGSSIDYGKAICFDSKGNFYVTADFSDSAFVADTLVSGWKYGSSLISKFSADGTLQWVVCSVNTAYFQIHDVVCDTQGNAYICGSFSDTATFGGFTLNGSWNWDTFIAKISPEGKVLWARRDGGEDIDQAHKIAIDSERGKLYVAGTFEKTMRFGNDSLTSAGLLDVYVASYNTNDATFNWARRGGGVKTDISYGIAVGKGGNIYTTGALWDKGELGGVVMTQSDYFMYLCCYNPQGTFQWAKKMCNSYSIAQDLVADTAGYLYAAGVFQSIIDTCVFGAKKVYHNHTGKHNVFTMKMDMLGEVLWARTGGGKSDKDAANGVAVDSAGNVYTVGKIIPPANFGSVPYFGADRWTVFEMKYDSLGKEMWLSTDAGTGNNEAMDVTADARGNVLLTGAMYDQSSFGLLDFTTRGDADIFLWKTHSAVITDVESLSASVPEFSITPHPVQHIATLRSAKSNISENSIMLCTALGSTVNAYSIVAQTPSTLSIDCSQLSTGIYYAIIRIQEDARYIPFVVVR